jgi:hypothetical protein
LFSDHFHLYSICFHTLNTFIFILNIFIFYMFSDQYFLMYEWQLFNFSHLRKLDQNIMSGHTITYLLILQNRKLNIPINNVNLPYLENWYNNYLFYVGCKRALWDSFKSWNQYMCSINTLASAILIYLDMMTSHEQVFSNIICI